MIDNLEGGEWRMINFGTEVRPRHSTIEWKKQENIHKFNIQMLQV